MKKSKRHIPYPLSLLECKNAYISPDGEVNILNDEFDLIEFCKNKAKQYTTQQYFESSNQILERNGWIMIKDGVIFPQRYLSLDDVFYVTSSQYSFVFEFLIYHKDSLNIQIRGDCYEC